MVNFWQCSFFVSPWPLTGSQQVTRVEFGGGFEGLNSTISNGSTGIWLIKSPSLMGKVSFDHHCYSFLSQMFPIRNLYRWMITTILLPFYHYVPTISAVKKHPVSICQTFNSGRISGFPDHWIPPGPHTDRSCHGASQIGGRCRA